MKKTVGWIAKTGPYIMMALSAAAVSCGFQLLLIPQKLLSSGVSGVAMIIGYVSGWNIGWLYFALNVPILIWGYRVLGRKFILLSMVTVIFTSAFMQFVPEHALTNDRLLACVFGGVLVGAGTAVTLRFGGSSGGFDIIASIISRHRDLPVGILVVALNAIVVAANGWLRKDWDAALYSMLSIYLTGKVIDLVHTPHRKVTAFIVTKQTDLLAAKLLTLPRGVTILKTRGGFTSNEQDMLMTVTTRYELTELRKIIRGVDPNAFVNVVQTIDVIGQFRRRPS
ncbi:YitT family protein [Cohnella faecalis]|uniref:YitT family protein n=1 Tax=Cohnella faecalis TaxID=2315694 RepID=A0A398CLP8_9BACL|nr:YitT family protein [Cohnella faecalis]RIE00571.1 YitT family protein [Cohnella faecalis]